jgi:hypothetical protein
MNSTFLRILTTYTRSHLTLPLAHSMIRQPNEIQFLASYPRSGSTWLRTMICNVLVPDANSDPQVFNRLIPGVSLKNLALVNQTCPTRYAFTHACYQSGIKKCVYIVRDGRDSIVSYYHYTTTRRRLKLSFQQWLDYYISGYYGPRWDENVLSWFGQAKNHLKDNLEIVHFEDLKSQPEKTLTDIITFLEIPSYKSLIQNAVTLSALEKAREREERDAGGKLGNANAYFYRGGKSGNWKELMNMKLHEKFLSVSKRAMDVAGYTSTI